MANARNLGDAGDLGDASKPAANLQPDLLNDLGDLVDENCVDKSHTAKRRVRNAHCRQKGGRQGGGPQQQEHHQNQAEVSACLPCPPEGPKLQAGDQGGLATERRVQKSRRGRKVGQEQKQAGHLLHFPEEPELKTEVPSHLSQAVSHPGNRTCAVATCPSPSGRHYYCFPKDKKAKDWVAATRRRDKVPVSSAKICDMHFSEDCFERDMVHEMLKKPLRKILKKTAVPTLHLLPSPPASPRRAAKRKHNMEREDRLAKKQQQQLVSDLLAILPEPKSKDAETSCHIVLPDLELSEAWQVKHDLNAQGFRYVAGYIAFRFQKKYPHLGSKTGDLPFHIETSAPWILHLSYGGLMLPTEEFIQACEGFEAYFQQFHGDLVDQSPDVMKRFCDILETIFKDEWPSDILMKYAKVRTFIRIRHLNYNLTVASDAPSDALTRKGKQTAQFIS